VDTERRGLRPGRAHWVALAVVLAALVALALTVPLPAPLEVRDRVHALGPWGAVAFLLVHALVTFAIVRRLGGRALHRVGARRVRMLEERMSSRGLLAVTSTRLVPAIPFAPLNYTLGLTSVRWWHYLVGTAIGLVPGTAAVVLLGDAATGTFSPSMLIVSGISGAIGLVGVVICARLPARRQEDAPDEPEV
jgi:uncharacterized membrane protein YdjX (TVP38/TMEM64 family)